MDEFSMPQVESTQIGTNIRDIIFPKEIDKNENPFIDNPNIETSQKETVAKGSKKIMDLFWILNEKITLGKQLGENEAQFVTISYNIDFGNLRIGYHTLANAIQGHVIFANKLRENTLVVGTLYPISLFKIGVMQSGKFRCVEQLITKTDEDWQKNRPATDIERTVTKDNSGKIIDDSITITVHNKESGISPWFKFTGWQKDALIYAARFAITTGFELFGQNIIKTR